MTDPEKLYLINCGDWYSLESAPDEEKAASAALLKIFKEKKWNISPVVLTLDVEKSFAPENNLEHMGFLSTENTLMDCGLSGEAQALRSLRDNLYSHLYKKWQKI